MAPPRAVPSPAGASGRDFQQGPLVSRTSAERLVSVSLCVPGGWGDVELRK